VGLPICELLTGTKGLFKSNGPQPHHFFESTADSLLLQKRSKHYYATFRWNILNTITQPYIICIAQNNYAPFTKNRREIVMIQKNYGVGGQLF
jgi:hypothetical protein